MLGQKELSIQATIFLYILVLMDTPLGKADGPAKPVFGMQIREARNDFSRDKPIEFCLPKNVRNVCAVCAKKFCGLEDDLSCILITNGIKPDLLTLKQLVFLANMIDATLKKNTRVLLHSILPYLRGYKKNLIFYLL